MLRDTQLRPWRAAAAIVAAGTMLATAGCSDGTSADGATEITFYSWDPPETIDPVVGAFEEAHPDISVEVSVATTPQEYASTLQTRLVAGTAEDVFILGDKQVQAGEGFVLDVTDQPFADRLSPANYQYGSFEDRLYGVSISSWGGGIVVNKQLLESFGYTEPPTSWDGFLEMVADIKGRGTTPFLEAGDGSFTNTACALLGLANEAVGGNLDEQVFAGGTTFAAHWTEPLEAWYRLFEQDLMTRDIVGITGDIVISEFIQGNVAMIGYGSWGLARLYEMEPDFDFEFWPTPGVEEGTSYWCGAASPAYAINADTSGAEQEAALAFLDFLTSEAGSRVYHEASGTTTTTSTYTPEVDPALEHMVEPLRAGDIYLPVVHWPEFTQALDAENIVLLQQMIQGQIPPSAVGEGMDRELQDLQTGR